jgi:arylformamidase
MRGERHPRRASSASSPTGSRDEPRTGTRLAAVTGRAASLPGVVVDREREARIAEHWARTHALRAAFRHELGLAYGRHPRQVLDLYYPAASLAPAPVLVFLHGGGLRRGETSYNGYLGRPYLERGGMFVSMGYRLVPELRFPDTCEDVEQGLGWLHEHLAARGGDPERLYLAGTSAGAVLAAMTALRHWPPACRLPPDLVKGLVIISGGMYDFANRSEEFFNPRSARFVADLRQAIERVPGHTIVVCGERDLPIVLRDSPALADAIRASGGSVELFVEAGADHYAAPDGFAGADGAVARAVARMMRLP